MEKPTKPKTAFYLWLSQAGKERVMAATPHSITPRDRARVALQIWRLEVEEEEREKYLKQHKDNMDKWLQECKEWEDRNMDVCNEESEGVVKEGEEAGGSVKDAMETEEAVDDMSDEESAVGPKLRGKKKVKFIKETSKRKRIEKLDKATEDWSSGKFASMR